MKTCKVKNHIEQEPKAVTKIIHTSTSNPTTLNKTENCRKPTNQNNDNRNSSKNNSDTNPIHFLKTLTIWNSQKTNTTPPFIASRIRTSDQQTEADPKRKVVLFFLFCFVRSRASGFVLGDFELKMG